ncbi:hypothetical protein ACH4C2_35895 [Streptomyces sp. NPDC018057]|uniref:hypothetical protein n=1 Tax=unclassified Streptomyces TaxID=2593676 RepID=UPI0037AE33A1
MADALLRLAALGMTTLVVDLPADPAEYAHMARVLDEAALRTEDRAAPAVEDRAVPAAETGRPA